MVPNRAELLIRSRVSARNEENGNESQGQGESEPLSPRDVILLPRQGLSPWLQAGKGWQQLSKVFQVSVPLERPLQPRSWCPAGTQPTRPKPELIPGKIPASTGHGGSEPAGDGGG